MRSTLIRKKLATTRPIKTKSVAPRPPVNATPSVAFVVKPEAVSLERWVALCG